MQAYSPLSWPRSSGAVTPQSARRFAEERFLSLWWQESLLPEEEKDEERSPFHIHDDADVEGVNTHAFEQFRVDLSYPRPKADKRWLALLVLANKAFLPKSFIWKLYNSERFKEDPTKLVQFAQAVNLVKMAGVAGQMTMRGEMTPLLLKRWVNPQSLVTM